MPVEHGDDVPVTIACSAEAVDTMLEVTFCEECGREIPAVSAWCPGCRTSRVPSPPVRSTLPATAAEPIPPDDGGFVECPQCAEPIRERAKLCRFCGYDLVRRARPGIGSGARRLGGGTIRVESVVTTRSPGVAAVLAFFYPGLGHIYAGRFAQGFGLMILPPLAIGAWLFAGSAWASSTRSDGGREAKFTGVLLIALIAAVVLYVWQIVNAYACASPQRQLGRGFRRRR